MPGGYTFDRLRDALALRIKAIPEFREKLADSTLPADMLFHPGLFITVTVLVLVAVFFMVATATADVVPNC